MNSLNFNLSLNLQRYNSQTCSNFNFEKIKPYHFYVLGTVKTLIYFRSAPKTKAERKQKQRPSHLHSSMAKPPPSPPALPPEESLTKFVSRVVMISNLALEGQSPTVLLCFFLAMGFVHVKH